MLNIKKIIVGPLETNCYLVTKNEDSILIDPGDDAKKILKEIGDKKIDYIVLTHLHFDHIGAVREIKNATGAKVFCSEKDLGILDESLLKKEEIDGFLEANYESCIMNHGKSKPKNHNTYFIIHNTIIPTPGHTPGSICLYLENEKTLFSGDTIFKGSVGVTHFKGGDFSKIKDSIENKLLTLPDDTLVYPGHGEEFRLGKYKGEIKFILTNSF